MSRSAQEVARGVRGRVLTRDIKRVVAEVCQIDGERLAGPSRLRSVTGARHIAMWLTRQLTGLSLNEIGKAFGCRHHTTVMNAVAVVDQLAVSDPVTRELLDGLTERLRGVG